jgi:hypothetical protein
MKAILIFFVLFLVSCKSTLNPKESLLFTYNDVYDWKDCVVPSEDWISKELPKIRKQFNEYVANIETIDQTLHFIDLNNDKKLDVIYSGTSGAESDCVIFLLNIDNDYRILYEEYTNIRDLIFDGGKLVGYIGLDFGCCADYIQKETKYSISEDWNRSVVYQRVKTSYTELPKKLFEKPVTFEIKCDTLKLRATPIIDDTNMFIYDTIGNVVSSYLKGSRGFVWSEKINDLGETWLFVEMDPNNNQIGSRINYNPDKMPQRNLGWFPALDLNITK